MRLLCLSQFYAPKCIPKLSSRLTRQTLYQQIHSEISHGHTVFVPNHALWRHNDWQTLCQRLKFRGRATFFPLVTENVQLQSKFQDRSVQSDNF